MGLIASVKGKVYTAMRDGASRIGHDFEPSFKDQLPEELRATLELVEPYTMTSPRRVAAVCDAIAYIERRGIAGAIVECGVWRGGSTMAAAKTLLNLDSRTREVYLYDTFEGMSEPTAEDRDSRTGAVAAAMLEAAPMTDSVWAYSSIDEVKRNVAKVGYPSEKIHFVQGKVEDTIPGTIPERIALLRLDTDWYESTRHELVHLYPRLEPGGVLIIDDYGHWEGARKAVDEYFAEHSPILLGRVDYTGRMGVKC